MAGAQRIEAEIKRLSQMGEDAFVGAVVEYAMGGTDKRAPRDVRGEALCDPQLAPRTLEALQLAVRRAKFFNPLQEGETKREQRARIVPWTEKIRAATPPFQDVVDDLAHEQAKGLAALDDDAFTDRWTDFVLGEPAPAPTSAQVEALAFRSPRVAKRAAEICRQMIEEPARFMPGPPADESGTAREQRIESFRRRVETETKFLRYAVQYAEARQGRMPSEPNHRLQALKLLGEAHPQELLQLLRQVRGEAKESRAEAKREQRDVRRARAGAAR
jgi:hypothetical protein